MRVAFFTGFTNWIPHYETELEIIQGHLDAGDTVIQFRCDGELFTCDANIGHAQNVCERCISRRRKGMELVDGRVDQRRYIDLTSEDRRMLALQEGRIYATIDELKKEVFEGFDIGYAVLSSLVSHLREPRPDLIEHRILVRDLMRSGLAVYCSIRNVLKREQVDRFYVFNGRFAIERAVLRACQERGVECYTHERGCNLDHYALYPNTLPHDLRSWKVAIEKAWDDQVDVALKTALARKFFEDRAKGQVQSWFSFVQDQAPGEMPQGFNPSLRNIVIFNSSEDEFAAIDSSHGTDVYADQQQAIRLIARDIQQMDGGVHVYVRSHPNLRTVDNSQTRSLKGFASPGVTIIPSDSPVSTYALMKAADLVITFGSTMGIEAAFWGKPSVMVGSAFYGGLGSVYEPRSHAEVMAMIRDGAAPLPVEGALKYGHRMSTFGTPYRFYRPDGVLHGSYKGRSLDEAPKPDALGRIIEKLPRRVHDWSYRFGLQRSMRNWAFRFSHDRGRIELLGLRRWWVSLYNGT